MHCTFDPELAPLVAQLPRTSLADLPATRAQIRALAATLPPVPAELPVQIHDTAAPGRPDIPVRVYAPTWRNGPLPGLLYLHGGGFVVSEPDLLDPHLAGMAAGSRAVVLAVDYRLAPEHPYPAAIDDCYRALTWTLDQAGPLGVDPTRIGAAGDSSGATLVAALALLTRDRHGPPLCFQFLGCPALDDRLDTPSMRTFPDAPGLSRENVELSWRYYLGPTTPPGSPDVSRYAAPARATDLTGLPPAHVVACEYDPLRDEALDYASRLLHAGVPTELHHYPGTFHGCQALATAAVSRRMTADALSAVRRGLHGSNPPHPAPSTVDSAGRLPAAQRPKRGGGRTATGRLGAAS